MNSAEPFELTQEDAMLRTKRCGTTAILGLVLIAGCLGPDADEFDIEGDSVEGRLIRTPRSQIDLGEADAFAPGDYCVGYKNTNRGGDPFTFTWPFDYNDLHRAPSFGDTMSSIECFGTGGLYLHTNSQWGGSSLLVTGYISNLASFGMNDNVSSVRWDDSTGTGYCVLWTNTNYSGSSLTINKNVDWNDLHRASPTNFGDVVSSIDCTNIGSDPIYLCKNDQWSTCAAFSGDDSDLHNNSYGDNISSVSWSL